MEKTDLYIYQNPKTARYVDNMVDNVDNRMWTTHTVHVNNRSVKKGFLRGKDGFWKKVLQEFLLVPAVNICVSLEEHMQTGVYYT